MRKRFTGVVESVLAPCASWVVSACTCASTLVVDTGCVENPQVRQKRRWGEFLAMRGHLLVCGAHLCVHVLGGDDHIVMIVECEEMHRVVQKRLWGAFPAICGLQCPRGAHPCVHTRGCGDRLVVIAYSVETRRVSGNVSGESLWLRGDLCKCVEHSYVTTCRVITTTQWRSQTAQKHSRGAFPARWRPPCPCGARLCVHRVSRDGHLVVMIDSM